MKKIAILGSPGSGKSTLARRLSDVLQTQPIHLDSVFWQADWEDRPRSQWEPELKELINHSHWILDGFHPEAIDLYLNAADTIIFLDIHPAICVHRVVMRFLRHHKRSRPDLPGYKEHLEWDFVKGVWYYTKSTRPLVLEKIQKYKQNRQIYHFRKASEAKKFLRCYQ